MWLNLSKTSLKLVKNDVHRSLIFQQSVKPSIKGVHVSKGIYKFRDISMNGSYRHAGIALSQTARAPSIFKRTMKGIVVRQEPVSMIPLTSFMKPEFPNIHKVLAPLYVLLGIFGSVLIANIGMISTAIGFYQFIANLGIVLTIASAIVLLWHTFKSP